MEAVLCILKESAIPVCTKLFPCRARTSDKEHYAKLAAFVYALYCTSAASDLAQPRVQPLQCITTSEFTVHVGEVQNPSMLVMLVCASTFSISYGKDLLERLCVRLSAGIVQGIFSLSASRPCLDAIRAFLERELEILTEQLVSTLFSGATLLRTASTAALSGFESADTHTSQLLKSDVTLRATSTFRGQASGSITSVGSSPSTCRCCNSCFWWWPCGSTARFSPQIVVPVREEEPMSTPKQVWKVVIGDVQPTFDHTFADQIAATTFKPTNGFASTTSLDEQMLLDGRELSSPLQTAVLHDNQRDAACLTLHGLCIEDRVFVWSGLEPGTVVARLSDAAAARACVQFCHISACLA